MGKARVPPTTPGDRPDSPFAVLAGVEVAPGPAAPVPAPVTGAVASGAPRTRGRVVLRRETKHRGGKAVIVVSGLGALAGFTREDAEALASRLKRRLGCGGTVETGGGTVETGDGTVADGVLELVLQGDRLEAVAGALRELGFRVDGC